MREERREKRERESGDGDGGEQKRIKTEERRKKRMILRLFKKVGQQHQVFPCGHPSQY